MTTLRNTKGILNLNSIIISPKTLILVFQNFEGNTLKKLLRSNKLKKTEINTIFQRVVEILKKIHNKRIIHGNLKLENILINSALEIHIFEFGCSWRFPYSKDRYKCPRLRSVHCLAPENFQNSKINCKHSILNIILFIFSSRQRI